MNRPIPLKQAAKKLGLSHADLVAGVQQGDLPQPDGPSAYSPDRFRLAYLGYRKDRPVLPPGCVTVAVANQKGGVGKTTVTLNLAATLAALGRRVLVADMDPQGNGSQGLGLAEAERQPGLSDAMIGEVRPLEAIRLVRFRAPGGSPAVSLALAPGGSELGMLEHRLKGQYKYDALWSLLLSIRKDYDFILIDTRPDILGFHTIAAILAADALLMVSSPEAYSLQGMAALSKKLLAFESKQGPVGWDHKVNLLGVAVNHANLQTHDHQAHLAELREQLPGLTLEPAIARSSAIAEAAAAGRPVSIHAPGSRAAAAFAALAQSFLERVNHERG